MIGIDQSERYPAELNSEGPCQGSCHRHSRGRAMTKKDWQWALGWSLVALLLANLPYLLGWVISTPENRFGGVYSVVVDGHSYLAKMRHAALDGWRFQLPYTHEPQTGAFGILFLYTLLGKALNLFTGAAEVGGLVAAYHGARVLAGPILLLVVYRFIAYFVDGAMRKLAFLVAVFATGLGWLLALLGWFAVGDVPLEFWAPDAFIFAILNGPPHIILAVPMLLAAILAMLEAWRSGRWRPALFAASITLVLPLIRPSYVLIYGAVMVAAWVVDTCRRRRASRLRAGQLAPALLAPIPLSLWLFQALYREPVLQQWTSQNPITSPAPWHYLAGYGLLIVPALWGLRRWRWWQEGDRWLLLLWLAMAPFLAYAPFQAQRRLIGGAPVALAIAAARGVWRGEGRRNWPAWAWLVLTLPSTLFITLGGTMMVAAQPGPLFHPPDEIAALDWLSHHTTTSDITLSAEESGNLIRVYADTRVVLGHPIETIQFGEKEAAVQAFFDPATPQQARREILRRYGVTLVYYGPWEKAFGGVDPERMPGLRQVFAEGSYRIYRVEE